MSSDEHQRVPVQFEPGISKLDSDDSNNRYVDGLNVRWVESLPEKIGGNAIISANAVTGTARSMLAWDDFSYNQWIAVGTNTKLYVYDSVGDLFNITPWRVFETSPGVDPFEITNGSAVIHVNDTAHGAEEGATVFVSGATAGGGITIAGNYVIDIVIGPDDYEITHSAPSNATDATSGGAAVKLSYEINPGLANIVFGGGFGVGPYGEGTYGTERSGSSFVVPVRVWSLDTYGQYLVALPLGGTVYEWLVDTDDRAVAVTNAPTGNYMFVTSERMITVLGADNDQMAMAWCDDDDNTIWTAASTNTANERRLQEGSKLVAGARLGQKINMIWSDTAVYIHQFTGSSAVYETRLVSRFAGLLGPNGKVVVNGQAYWISNGTFMQYTGYVDEIPNVSDIRKFFFDRLTVNQGYKIVCTYIQAFDEIQWDVAVDGETEPVFWVAYNRKAQCWYFGERERTASCVQETIQNRPLMIDHDGNVHWHEYPGDVNDNGAAIPWSLQSGYQEFDNGMSSLDIWGYFADFKRQTGQIDVTISAKDVMNGETVIESETESIIEDQGVADFHLSGRLFSFLMEANAVDSDFRLGIPKLEFSPGGERR
jgi:hypothetical protein